MKKTIILVMVCVLVLAAGSAFAGIANSKHNLTSTNVTGSIHTNDTAATLCGFCHIPHGANTSIAGLPLWGRAINATPSYMVYGGNGATSGVTSSGTAVGQPGAFSLTCLSCHDGTIGLGVNVKYGQATAGYLMSVGAAQNAGYLSGNNLAFLAGQSYEPMINDAGVGLQNDHPIGLTYTDAGNNYAGLTSLANAKTAGYKFFGNGADQMECASCHEPHQDPATKPKFLRVTNPTTVDFCVGCHALK